MQAPYLADFWAAKLPLSTSLHEAAQDRSAWKRLVCDLFFQEGRVSGSGLAGIGETLTGQFA
eukprot:1904736-Amphidinium_carterae.2